LDPVSRTEFVKMQRPGDTGISYTPVTSVVNSSELRLKVDR